MTLDGGSQSAPKGPMLTLPHRRADGEALPNRYMASGVQELCELVATGSARRPTGRVGVRCVRLLLVEPGPSSDPVAPGESLSSCLRSCVGGAGAVALEHDVGGPAGEALEVALLATGHQEVVGERVPEAVRVQVLDPRRLTTHPDTFPRPVCR